MFHYIEKKNFVNFISYEHQYSLKDFYYFKIFDKSVLNKCCELYVIKLDEKKDSFRIVKNVVMGLDFIFFNTNNIDIEFMNYLKKINLLNNILKRVLFDVFTKSVKYEILEWFNDNCAIRKTLTMIHFAIFEKNITAIKWFKEKNFKIKHKNKNIDMISYGAYLDIRKDYAFDSVRIKILSKYYQYNNYKLKNIYFKGYKKK